MHLPAFAAAIARPAFWFALPLSLCAVACGGGSEQKSDPCRDVVCLVGQDCIDGVCVDRPGEGGSGGGGGTGGCRSAADCAFDPAGPLCDPGRGACVECLEDANCPEGETCRNGTCAGGCTGDAECPAETPWCRLATGVCVECLGPEHCDAGEDCRANACVPQTIACASDGDCAVDPTRPRCRLTGETGVCVECLDGADCGEAQACIADACVSVSCTADADCAAVPGLPRCDLEASRCVACLGDGDCAEGERCVERACTVVPGCAVDADCREPTRPICDPASGACRACAGDVECTAPETGRCAPTGACLGCLGDDDCGGAAPRCSPAGACVGCLSSGDCGAGETCTDGTCIRPVACTGDAGCAGGFVCDRGACVACRTDAECPRGTCVAGACVDRAPCVSDAGCARGLCVGGACVACAGDLDCRQGLWCEAGACVERGACGGDAECAAGRACVGGACAPAACADDRNEPDAGPSTARPYAPGLPVSGVLCPNDEDWLALAAGAGSGLEATLIGPPPGATLSLVWYDAATGAWRERLAYENRVKLRALPAAAAGRYFLRVRSGGAAGGYTVLAVVRPNGGECADALEPNDVRTAARVVPHDVLVEGLTLCGDDDFFRVDVPAGRKLSAYAFFPGGDLRLETFTLAGSRIDGGAATGFLGGGRVATAGPAPAGGTSYLVRASGGTTAPAAYSLYLAAAADPACDPAPALIAAGADRGRAAGSTLGHAVDRGTACGAGGPDATHAIHLDAESGLAAAVRGGYDARLFLVDATCGENLTCAPAAGGDLALDVARLPPGDYVLVVGGAPGKAGPYDVVARRLPPADPPANDTCAAAEPLDVATGEATVSGSTRGAGAEHDPACGGLAPDVFYRFGLAVPSRVILDLVADRPVWLGVADPACAADDACSPAATVHHLDVTLPAGDHVIAVGSSTGASAAFQLAVTLPPELANDTCAGAAPLSVPGTVAGDTTWARDDLHWALAASCTGYYTTGGELFHAVALSAGQSITATLAPAGWDGALYVIDDCAAPACLAGVDAVFAGGVETLPFTAPATGTYRLVVDGAVGGGAYTLAVQ
jgi:Cys-rich repeat protein